MQNISWQMVALVSMDTAQLLRKKKIAATEQTIFHWETAVRFTLQKIWMPHSMSVAKVTEYVYYETVAELWKFSFKVFHLLITNCIFVKTSKSYKKKLTLIFCSDSAIPQSFERQLVAVWWSFAELQPAHVLWRTRPTTVARVPLHFRPHFRSKNGLAGVTSGQLSSEANTWLWSRRPRG